MYKLISFVRRKPGISKQEFQDYYENHHAKLGVMFLVPHCVKYLRRYIEPVRHPMKPHQPPHPEFDCLVELWFESEAACRSFEATVADPEKTRLIIEDEEKFVDRANTFRFVVEDHLGWGPAEAGRLMPGASSLSEGIPMPGDDTSEIINLLNLYAFAVDTLEWDLFDRVFTADAHLDYPRSTWTDLATFKKDFADAHAPLHTTQHMVTNHQVLVNGDTANSLSYARARLVRTFNATTDDFGEFGGWYDDVLIRTAAGWRIKTRVCLGNWSGGNMSSAVVDQLVLLRDAAKLGKIAYLNALKTAS